MRYFRYWMPGGMTGTIKAATPFAAAQKRLNKPVSTGGNDPFTYIDGDGSGNQLKLWETRTFADMKENPLSIKPLGANQTELTLDDGTTVFFSYKTPVAAHIPGEGYYRTEKKWSVTTSRHISNFLRNASGSSNTRTTVKPQEWFDTLASGMRNNPKRGINDSDREQWVSNDEGLYNMQRRSHLPMREFIKQNRTIIDEVINNVTNSVKPAHYLMYRNPKGKRMARRRSSKRPSRKQLAARRRFAAMARSGALKRRRHRVGTTRSRAVKRRVRASTASHPYFSKLPIHVQEQRKGSWHTCAGFHNAARAIAYARILKRHVGRVPVRVVDVR